MAEGVRKCFVAAQALFLLLPATLAGAFIVFLSAPAYPQRSVSPPQLAFDVALLLTIAGLAAGWRLALLYLWAGRAAVRRAHSAWFVLLALGALLGLLGAAVTTAHLLDPLNPGVAAGFSLFAPGALLAPLAAQFGVERLR